MRRTTLPRWKQCELDFIENNIAQYPLIEFAEQLQAMQHRLKMPVRSTKAIAQKVRKLGYDKSYQEDRLSKSQMAEMLGVPRSRVTIWIDKGLKYSQRYKNREVSILVADFRQWAGTDNNIGHLYGIERCRLEYFLPPKLCENIRKTSPNHHPVKCLETGITFRSIADAAVAIDVSKTGVWRAIAQGRKVKNRYTFERLAV